MLAATRPDHEIDAELAAHDAVGRAEPAVQRHVATLHDLVTLADGRLALIVDHVPGPTLDDVVAQLAGRFTLGELTTVLAPLALAIESAHAVGLTGLGLEASTVRLSAAGAPIMTRIADAVAGPALPERYRALDAAYTADLAALERLGGRLAAAVSDSDQAAALAALAAARHGVPLAHALFDLGPPLPIRRRAPDESGDDGEVRVNRDRAVSGHAAAHLHGGVATPLSDAPALAHPDLSRSTSGDTLIDTLVDTVRALGLPAGVVDPVRAGIERGRQALASARVAIDTARNAVGQGRSALPSAASARVRPRFVLAGAAGVTALVLAVVVSLAANREGAAAGADTDDARPTETVTSPDAVVGQGSLPESELDPEPEHWQGIVTMLVERWIDCRARPQGGDNGANSDRNDSDDHNADSIDVGRCAAGVVHAGSAAEQLITREDARHGLLERWLTRRGDAVVLERMGGAVLIDLVVEGTTTASLLVVRSEAGWRIRDVLG